MKPKGSNYRPWTKAEIAALEQGARAMMTSAQMIEALFPYRSKSSINQKLSELRLGPYHLARAEPIAMVRPVAEYRAPEGPTLVEAFAPEDSADESEEAFLSRVMGTAVRSIEKAKAQRHARLRIASDRPIAISLSSDWHISTHGTDLPALKEYAEYVGRTPDLYALGVGDLLDNPIKHKGGNVGQIGDDLRLLDILVGCFKGKLLGTTSGNHDDWSKTLAGTDHLQALARRHRIHYAPDELLWVVEIVNPLDVDEITATYRIHTRHQWRRHSNLNPLHACWTWLQEEGPNWDVCPDVLAIGHNHTAAHGCHQFEQRDVWGLRMGAWQIDSSYARAKGFARYRATAPTVVLCPTRDQRVQCFSDPQDAVRFMNGEQSAVT